MSKRGVSSKRPVTNHLSSKSSFQFALNLAVLATLMAVMMFMVGMAFDPQPLTDNRTKAAPIEQIQLEP